MSGVDWSVVAFGMAGASGLLVVVATATRRRRRIIDDGLPIVGPNRPQFPERRIEIVAMDDGGGEDPPASFAGRGRP